MKRPLFLHSFFILLFSAVAFAGPSLFHPADRNGDWKITEEESQKYVQQWQLEYTPMIYAIQAMKFSQGGGWYHYLTNTTTPHSWAAGSVSQPPPPTEGVLMLGSTATAATDTEVRIPVIYKSGESLASVLLFTVSYPAEAMVFQQLVFDENKADNGKTVECHDKPLEGLLTIVVYGGQDPVAEAVLTELQFLLRSDIASPLLRISIQDQSAATPDAQPLQPEAREGAVFVTAAFPDQD